MQRPVQQRTEQRRSPAPAGDGRSARFVRGGRLVVAARRVDRARLPEGPGALLAAMDPPRGVWRRRGRWGVWGGSAATLEAPPDEGCRFAAIRSRSEDRAGRARGARSDATGGRRRSAPPLPRFYGGFSFHREPGSSHRGPGAPGAWSSFPPGRFRVPAREVRVEDEAAWILAARPRGTDDSAVRRDLDRLEADVGRGTDAGEGGAPAPGPEAEIDRGLLANAGGERGRWERSVEEALGRIRDGRLEKVVLARTLDVPAAGAAGPVRAFRRLGADNPRSSLFFVEPDQGTAFLGASPELLGAVRGDAFRATAVAGSVPRGSDRREDRALGRRLLESDKDRREQAIVTEEIRRCLAPRLRAVSVGSPHLLKLARIQHLESTVEGRLPRGPDSGAGHHLLDVVADLHPTPAVCGRPRDEALRVLRRAERFDRGWYAGPVGWFDPAGQGEFVPGLRSAVLHGDAWRLFAGAGIVEGSDPGREWEETGVKFAPVLRALGVGGGP